MKIFNKVVAGVLVGGLIGAALSALLLNKTDQSLSADAKPDKPAYWVAPMDDNYRRDKPGKSPMGMDLIPVYSEPAIDAEAAATGGVFISPALINNLAVRTAPARRDRMHSSISTVGYVQYDEERIVHIHSRAEGWIETLHARSSGSSIEKGEPLYALYSPQIVNAQKEFLLALRSDNAQLIEASESRLKVFHIDDNFIRQLAQNRQVQRTVTFYAPQSGILHNLSIREGFFIKPETTLMSIAALDEVWIEAQVFQRQADQLNRGAAVSIKVDSNPQKIWRGVVDYIYPALDATTRTLRVRVRLANSNGELKPNMFAEVEIAAKPHEISVLVPKDAVIRTATENRVVLALAGGGFKSVAVQLGHLNEKFAEIRSGIEAGDQVVISAQFLLDSESNKNAGLMRLSAPEAADGMGHKVMGQEAIYQEAMDQEAMEHKTMTPKAIDHSAMDHSAMDHKVINHSQHQQ